VGIVFVEIEVNKEQHHIHVVSVNIVGKTKTNKKQTYYASQTNKNVHLKKRRT
jgi:signal recognition particle GTPase